MDNEYLRKWIELYGNPMYSGEAEIYGNPNVVGAAASVSVSMSISILVSERVLKFVKFSPVTALAMACVYAMGRGIGKLMKRF